ncbi:hypothetical protein LJC40_02275 [Synergistaceae bacterium OttesenSCG-928-D05]|nr:hypothetical protein [Synergistaceae bacterium OttesenSCG-928-D05]
MDKNTPWDEILKPEDKNPKNDFFKNNDFKPEKYALGKPSYVIIKRKIINDTSEEEF